MKLSMSMFASRADLEAAQKKQDADKASHTPGPWSYELNSEGAVVLGVRDELGGFPVVCDVPPRTRNGNHESNAALIAAAPDMLAALRESLAALEWAVEQGGGPVCEHESGGAVCFCKENNAISSARAAIAKAEAQS